VISDPKVVNPLYLEELPNTLSELRVYEGVIINNLISLHYKIEETKKKLGVEFRSGRTDRARALIAKNSYIMERKMFLEKKLEKVQNKIKALQ
jgi:hypothetical protein